MIENFVPITMWCSLYCGGTEAVGDMHIDYGEGRVLSLPLGQECADPLQMNPALSLDLRPVEVLELDE